MWEKCVLLTFMQQYAIILEGYVMRSKAVKRDRAIDMRLYALVNEMTAHNCKLNRLLLTFFFHGDIIFKKNFRLLCKRKE